MTAPKPRWRVFLRPGWITLAIAVVLFSVLCFWVFAPWQLGKHGKTEQRNDRIERAFTAPPAPLADLLRAQVGPESEWRAVTVTGVYDSDKQVLLRDRTVHGNAQGPQVLVPLRLADGTSILVDRGYLPQSTPSAPPAPTGPVTLRAKLRLAEITPAGRETRTLPSGAIEVPAIDPPAIQRFIDLRLGGSTVENRAYLQLDPGQPGALGALEEPNLDPGPYLSYGLQWLAFGVIALGALGYFGYSELRPAFTGQGGAAPTRASDPQPGSPGRAERKRQLRAALAGKTYEPAAASGTALADRYQR